MKKVYKIILIAIVNVFVIALLFIGVTAGLPALFNHVARAERALAQDYEMLTIMIQFLADAANDSNARIDRNDMRSGEVWISSTGYLTIEDTSVLETLSMLGRRGYGIIRKYDDTIMFQRWATRNVGRGLAFSIDGSESFPETVTDIESLSQANWFYYVADFWERQRRQRDAGLPHAPMR